MTHRESHSAAHTARRDRCEAVSWALPRGFQELTTHHPAVVAELIDIFLTDSIERLKTIGDCEHSGDRATASREAHSIKGASQQLGAAALAEICRELELRGATSSDGEFSEMVVRLQREFGVVADAMRPCRDQLQKRDTAPAPAPDRS